MSALLLVCVLFAMPLAAQDSLSLKEAARKALENHPSLDASHLQIQATEERVRQAKSALLPRVSYSESFSSGNNPVYVFGTLLTQRRFGAANFALDSLNNPESLNNFQSQLGIEQILYDFGGIKSSIASAEAGNRMSKEQERAIQMNVVAQVAQRYHAVALADASLSVAKKAAESAEADLARAKAIRDAGMSTDSDVLSIQVHLAGMKEQVISKGYAAQMARAALNDAMGLPLDTRFTLTSGLAPQSGDTPAKDEIEKRALVERPEVRQTGLAREIAESQRRGFVAALYPQIFARGALEADRSRFLTQGGANWYFSAGLRWTLYDGSANRSKITEAGLQAATAKAKEREVRSGVQLQVRQSVSALQSAGERIQVAAAAVTQAEESLRITKNRYEAGLNTVSDLLRTEVALLEASTRHLAAIHDQRVAAVLLELAAGTLTGDSDVLQ